MDIKLDGRMNKATAVFIRTESGDYYLYNLQGHLTVEEAHDQVEDLCPEYHEHWCDFLVQQTIIEE